MPDKKIGWIGLGNMGKPMSRRILEAGYPLVVYNRTRQKTEEISKLGAEVASSPAEVADKADVVFTMIADDRALREVVLGKKGVLEGAKGGLILIDMSTVSPDASAQVNEACEKKGVIFLRAPVSGSTALAKAGTLGIMVSGDENAFSSCKELLQVLGKKIFYVGGEEEARYMKLVLNIMIGISAQMLAEAVTWGKKAGVDVAKMMEVMNDSAVASPFVGYKTRPIVEHDFTPAFTIKMMEKDYDLILSVGDKLGVPTPLTAVVRQLLTSARATGKGELDIISLLGLMEEMAGMKV